MPLMLTKAAFFLPKIQKNCEIVLNILKIIVFYFKIFQNVILWCLVFLLKRTYIVSGYFDEQKAQKNNIYLNYKSFTTL